MKTINIIKGSVFGLILLLPIIAILGFAKLHSSERITVRGILLSSTGKPIPNALVSVRLGEEETLSKADGSFIVETASQPPFILTVEHPDYQKATQKVEQPDKKLTIQLTLK
jgi:uncharacterized membrane protein